MRYAPPAAASMPERITEAYRTAYTLMPTVSAARGCSPQARIRSPIGVLNMTTYETKTSAIPTQIIRLRCPNASEKNEWLLSLVSLTSGICEMPVGTFCPW